MTPEDELSFVARHNLDVTATILCAAFLVPYAAWRLLHAVFFSTASANRRKAKAA